MAPHVLCELLEVSVYRPDQGPHVIHHLDIPDLSCLQKLNIAPIKRHFSERFTVTKMCAIHCFMLFIIFKSISRLVIE